MTDVHGEPEPIVGRAPGKPAITDLEIERRVREFVGDNMAGGDPDESSLVDLSRFVKNVLAGEPRGERFGPYRVIGFLGRGGMGIVLRARHVEDGTIVALKTAQAGTQLAAALKHEAATLSRVLHPHIIRVHATGEDNGIFWAAFDLIEGETLSDQIARAARTRGNPPVRKLAAGEVRTIVGWFADLARALHELHEAGYVHRDIKPANIMIRKNSDAYLIDFGLAFDEDTPDPIGKILAGTAPYMSPEQWLNGILAFDCRSDVYSLCASLFEALVGWPLAAGRGFASAQVTLYDPPPRPSLVSPYVPRVMDDVVLKGLAKRATDRFVSAQELATALDASTRRLGTIRGLTRRGRRLLTVSAVVALATLSVIGFLLVKDWIRRGEGSARLLKLEQSVEKQLDAGQYGEALGILRGAPSEIQKDVRFKLLHERAAWQAGPHLLQTLLRSQVFSLDTPTEIAERRTTESIALFHLRALDWVNEPLAIIAAYTALMGDRPKDALDVLDQQKRAQGKPPSRALDRLRALVLMEDNRASEADALLAGLPSSPERHASAEESYLFVLTAVWRRGDRTEVDLELASREVEALVAEDSGSGLGYTLRGLVRFSQQRFSEAYDDWNRLLFLDSTRDQTTGVHVRCAEAAMLASESSSTSRQEWLTKAAGHLVEAECRVPGAAEPLLREVAIVRAPTTVTDALKIALAARRPDLPPTFARDLGKGLFEVLVRWVDIRANDVLSFWAAASRDTPALVTPPGLFIDNVFCCGEAAFKTYETSGAYPPIVKEFAPTWARECERAVNDPASNELTRIQARYYAALMRLAIGDSEPAGRVVKDWDSDSKAIEAFIGAALQHGETPQNADGMRMTVASLHARLVKELARTKR